MENYLQYLIPDPQVGYLYPHRHAIAALGVPNEYHLNKHRAALVENQHWFKLRGADHIDRIFYSLDGLLQLAERVGTPQAQAFKQAVQEVTAAGAMVKASPQALCERSEGVLVVGTAEVPTLVQPEAVNLTHSPVPSGAWMVDGGSAWMAERGEQAANVTGGNPGIAGTLTPQDTAAIIFEAQRVAGAQMLEAQRVVFEQQQQCPPIQVNITLWERWNSWMDQQNAWNSSLVLALSVILAGFGSYWLVAAATRGGGAPEPPSQTIWRNTP